MLEYQFRDLKKRVDTYLSGQDEYNMGKKSAYEAGKKHVADLLVGEKDIDYEVITF